MEVPEFALGMLWIMWGGLPVALLLMIAYSIQEYTREKWQRRR